MDTGRHPTIFLSKNTSLTSLSFPRFSSSPLPVYKVHRKLLRWRYVRKLQKEWALQSILRHSGSAALAPHVQFGVLSRWNRQRAFNRLVCYPNSSGPPVSPIRTRMPTLTGTSQLRIPPMSPICSAVSDTIPSVSAPKVLDGIQRKLDASFLHC